MRPAPARHRPTTGPRRAAFTLVELLTVVAILGLLVAVLLPAVQAARSASRRTACLSHIRQLGLALVNYHDARDGFPTVRNRQFWSWITRTLPFAEEQPLYDAFDFSQDAFPPGVNQPQVSTILPLLLCPADPGSARVSRSLSDYPFAYTNYLGVAGSEGGVGLPQYQGNGMFPGLPYGRDVPIAVGRVTDGTSQTLLVGERPVVDVTDERLGDWGWWAAGSGHLWLPYGRGDNVLDSSRGLRPGNPTGHSLDSVYHWWSYHGSGAHFTLVDGSARLLSYGTDHRVLLALSTRNGKERARGSGEW